MADNTDKLKERLEKSKIGLWAAGAFIVYLGIWWLFPLPSQGADGAMVVSRAWPLGIPAEGLALEVRSALGGAFVSFFAFGAVLQVFQWSNLSSELEFAIRRVFTSNTPLVEGFSRPKKRDFVATSLQAMLGSEIGRATFQQLVPLLKDNSGFRKDFRYQITLGNEAPDLGGAAWADKFPLDRYRWVKEDLSYKLYYPAADSYSSGPFKVVFLFDRETLNVLNPRQDIFARFLIELDPEECAWLQSLSEAEALDFAHRALEPHFTEFPDYGDETALAIDFKFVPANGDVNKKRLPHFEATMAPLAAEEGTSKVRLRFTYPYSRSATHYTVSLPQPIESPDIYFFYGGAGVENVDYISYLSSDPKRVRYHDQGSGYHIDVDQCWVYPTSGVTFVWKNSA